MSAPILELKRISRDFGKRSAIKDLSFSVRENELLSIVGPSGCGKTVLLKMISGLLSPSGGSLAFARPGLPISMAFQNSPLFPWMTVLENLLICMNDATWDERKKTDLALEHLSRAGMVEFKNHFPSQISGGMQQRVNVIRAFCVPSELILMDEPFAFLDAMQRRNLQEFTLDIWSHQNKTLVFVTHDIDEAIYLSDRVLLFSPSPGSLVRELKIPFERPRNRLAISRSAEYPKLLQEVDEVFRNAR